MRTPAARPFSAVSAAIRAAAANLKSSGCGVVGGHGWPPCMPADCAAECMAWS